ncbi:MAG: hypothetical protein U9R58_01335 [Chloroflexota bacterium]|nr:hypothetical protein [Chloroflexota bacterium]
MTLTKIKVDTKAEYSIRVVGYLDESWSDRMGGLTIVSSQTGASDKKPVTALTGVLIDQAALFGVLNTLYDMRLPLLSVECFSIEREGGQTAAS